MSFQLVEMLSHRILKKKQKQQQKKQQLTDLSNECSINCEVHEKEGCSFI